MTRRPRLLVVDDSVTVRAALSAILDQAGFEVHVANDGRGALDAARRIQPEAILLDLRLPGARDPATARGGEEVLRKLKADARLYRVPVFMVTGEPDARSAESLRRLGAAGYFGKPFDPGAVIRALWEAI